MAESTEETSPNEAQKKKNKGCETTSSGLINM